jgi:hypothetical protein
LEAQASAMADTLEVFWTNIRDRMANTCTITVGNRFVTVDQSPNVEIGAAPSTPITGFASGEPLPWVVQGLVRLNTGLAERGGKGRIFIPYITEQWSALGVLEPVSRADIQAQADALVAAASTADTSLVIWHRDLESASDVISAFVPAKFAYLASRRD